MRTDFETGQKFSWTIEEAGDHEARDLLVSESYVIGTEGTENGYTLGSRQRNQQLLRLLVVTHECG